jgi:hypothetical protein
VADKNHSFARTDVFPSYFANRIQEFLTAAHTGLALTKEDATHVRVVPDGVTGLAACAIQGRWRWVESTINRIISGGAGTVSVWACASAENVDNTPDAFTDHTDYSFSLRITTGANPTGFDIFEKIGEVDWDGAAITAVRQTYGRINPERLDAVPLSGLAGGAAGKIIVCNAAGVPQYVVMSGDVGIDNAGATSIEDLEQAKLKNFDAPVTSLPSSPADGDMCVFAADATNGIYWLLRYRAGSASAYKWEYLGGEELFAEVLGSLPGEGTTSASYTNLATVGPSITTPLAGDYKVEVGGHGYQVGGAGLDNYLISYAIGATPASDDDAVIFYGGGPTTGATLSRRRRKNGLGAGAAIVSKYKTEPSGAQFYFLNRFLSIKPIRVG